MINIVKFQKHIQIYFYVYINEQLIICNKSEWGVKKYISFNTFTLYKGVLVCIYRQNIYLFIIFFLLKGEIFVVLIGVNESILNTNKGGINILFGRRETFIYYYQWAHY